MVKIIDMMSKETGEIIGYFKKAENEENWTWVMYDENITPVVIDANVPTYQILNWTRAQRKCELIRGVEFLYRLIKVCR